MEKVNQVDEAFRKEATGAFREMDQLFMGGRVDDEFVLRMTKFIMARSDVREVRVAMILYGLFRGMRWSP